MERLDDSLLTPIYLKTLEQMPWPDDQVFYLLTSDNLYLCRNHEFFRSCVPAPRWPSELAEHTTRLTVNYPKISRALIEKLCGFFDHIWWHYGAEAIAFLAWDRSTRRVHTIVPRQLAAVGGVATGRPYPIGVKYEPPKHLSPDVVVFCDIHSHCDMAAYSSFVDVDDEKNLSGLHIVVGQLQREPPDFHVEAVVDGTRFSVRPPLVIPSYECRRQDFPAEWVHRVRVVDYSTYRDTDFGAHCEDTKTAAPKLKQPGSDPTSTHAAESEHHPSRGSTEPELGREAISPSTPPQEDSPNDDDNCRA